LAVTTKLIPSERRSLRVNTQHSGGSQAGRPNCSCN
jgi:hypothetical protein